MKINQKKPNSCIYFYSLLITEGNPPAHFPATFIFNNCKNTKHKFTVNNSNSVSYWKVIKGHVVTN